MARDWTQERWLSGDHGVSSANTGTPMNVIDYGQYDRPTGCTCPEFWFGVVPPHCPIHNPGYVPFVPYIPPTTTTITTWPPGPQRLSDEDVDRIARRVLEMQREERARADHDPGDEG